MISFAVIRSATLASGSLKLSNSRSPFCVSVSWPFRQYVSTNWESTFCPGASPARARAAIRTSPRATLRKRRARISEQNFPEPTLNGTAGARAERLLLDAHALGDIDE